MNDLVSIIMPSYNSENYIRKSIQSVLSQTYENFELIIIDDHSLDNTVQVVTDFNDERIRLIANDLNRGAAYCRNVGIENAKGRFIAFLDSDDFWDKEKLTKQIAFMEENKCAFSYTSYYSFNEEKNKIDKIISGPKKITKRMLFNYCYVGCLTVVIDTTQLEVKQIPDSIMKRNDYAIWLNTIKKNTVCQLIDEPLAIYTNRSSNSISSGSKLRLIKYHYSLVKILFNYSSVRAMFFAFRNVFFYFHKKIVYEKNIT